MSLVSLVFQVLFAYMLDSPSSDVLPYFCPLSQYAHEPCGSCLYCAPFLGVVSNVIPHPFSGASDATLPILEFYIIFFYDFFLFLSQRTLRIFIFI